MEILFTQYLMPDGHRREVLIDRPDDVAGVAMALISRGYRFECEILSDMQTVSLTVVGPKKDDGDVAIELCENGPGVGSAVDRLVAAAAVVAA